MFLRRAKPSISTFVREGSQIVSAVTVTEARWFSLGGRRTPPGFSRPLERAPQVKQSVVGGVARRIPGTTKVQYTNNKGRKFTFSIPVSEMMQPPVLRNAPGGDRWKLIDTSYCDLGDLEDDMPSPVDECLNHHTQSSIDADPVLDAESLRDLQKAFTTFCRDYVLMDTSGMTNTLTYSELHTGPDYEMYDRKTMRKRYWLAIRRRWEDIKELLWPSDLLEQSLGSAAVESGRLLLSSEDMLEALVWLEAASTFCVRRRHAYDVANEEEFHPIDLHREVQVLARRAAGEDFLGGGAAATAKDGASEGGSVTTRDKTDRFISCAALSATHRVPFSDFFPCNSGLGEEYGAGTDAVARVLGSLPALTCVLDAIRIMRVLESINDSTSAYAFSNTAGEVTDFVVLRGLVQLCGTAVFADSTAMENTDEAEVCVAMRLAVCVREQNRAFFHRDSSRNALHHERDELLRYTHLVLSRCRNLLYRRGGSPSTVMSGDDENIPFVELQKYTEARHPLARIHHKIGIQNAQGLRFVSLQATSTATLLELLDRLENAGEAAGLGTLVGDMVQHIAQRAAMSKANLSLQDVNHVLPLLAKMMTNGTEEVIRQRYDRLLAACSTAIGTELQRPRTALELTTLLEGLAACRYIPSCYKQIEMVVVRQTLQSAFTATLFIRCLTAMLQLGGGKNMSPILLQSAATVVMDGLCGIDRSSGSEDVETYLTLVHILRYCSYDDLPSLVLGLRKEGAFDQLATWPATCRCAAGSLIAIAAASVPDEDPLCVSLCEEARGILEDGLRCVNDGSLLANKELGVVCITTAAALGMKVIDTLRSVAEQCAGVHKLCTPNLAVGVLESLASLGLTCTPMYETYQAYLVKILSQLHALSEQHYMSSVDDVKVAERVLYLPEVSHALVINAVGVLNNEIVKLDNQLTQAGQGRDRASSTTFEKAMLARNEHIGQAEENVLRYCAAIRQCKVAQQLTDGMALPTV